MPRSRVNLGSKAPSWRFQATWYAISVALLLLLPLWKFGFPIWRLPRAQWRPFSGLIAAFLVSAAVATLFRSLKGPVKLPLTAVATLAAFGAVFLGFYLARTDFSRAVALVAFVVAVPLVLAPYVVPESRWLRVLLLGMLLTPTVVGWVALDIPHSESLYSTTLVKTEYYNLVADTYSASFPKLAVRGGGMGRIGDRYLLLTGDGHLYAFNWEGEVNRPEINLLPYRVPINGETFSKAAGRPWAISSDGGDPAQESHRLGRESEILHPEWFRTYGLLVQDTGSDTRIFVSHPFWKEARECWVERVSVLAGDRAAILRGDAGPEWRTLYETSPCLPVHGDLRRRGIPFVGYFGGGRMALLDARTLLLTVGDFGFDGVASTDAHAQDPATSYGKTIAIDIVDGRAVLFTLGHRNPEGLYIARSGAIWSTEHGPQGGDELNHLQRGANYGWPYMTDGTDYGSFSWPLNRPRSEQRDYQGPVFSWVPSIAVSNLIGVERGLFPEWQGDLLIATLKARTLFRAHLRGNHVAYIEPIYIGSGIRDLIEGHDGRIILWTDSDTLISLRPKSRMDGEALFAAKCTGCHPSTLASGNGIGPNLFGVVGRRIASLPGYSEYSSGMRRMEGRWTEPRLDAFLSAPKVACPGTAMEFAGDANVADRAAIIGYLGTLR